MVTQSPDQTDLYPSAGEDLHDCLGVFVSKFSTDGDYLWGRTWGAGPWAGYTYAPGVAAGENGSVFVPGYYSETGVNFAPSDFCDNDPFTMDASGNCDLFVVKYLSDGCW